MVPLSEVAHRRRRAFNWLCVGFLLVSVVVLVIGIRTDTAVVLTGVAMLIATALLALLGVPFVVPLGQVVGDWVWLSFVDRRFADALDRWYGDRRPP